MSEYGNYSADNNMLLCNGLNNHDVIVQWV